VEADEGSSTGESPKKVARATIADETTVAAVLTGATRRYIPMCLSCAIYSYCIKIMRSCRTAAELDSLAL
jgi:hypothetical protein